ncbi:MAG: ribonuclease III [Clostridia bacterium]|nr:ribonuclease III [Clostridia bacterium]
MSLIISSDAPLAREKLAAMPVQALAFVGDAVYSLLVREYLAEAHPDRRNLHNLSVAEVNCRAQSEAAQLLLPLLSEEETAVYKRGRNNTASTPPKKAEVTDYRRATGVEALFGWLYLAGKGERINELFSAVRETLIQ